MNTNLSAQKELYDVTFQLKSNKTFKELFDEAAVKHPNNEDARIQFVADLMREIGFNISTQISSSKPIDQV